MTWEIHLKLCNNSFILFYSFNSLISEIFHACSLVMLAHNMYVIFVSPLYFNYPLHVCMQRNTLYCCSLSHPIPHCRLILTGLWYTYCYHYRICDKVKHELFFQVIYLQYVFLFNTRVLLKVFVYLI